MPSLFDQLMEEEGVRPSLAPTAPAPTPQTGGAKSLFDQLMEEEGATHQVAPVQEAAPAEQERSVLGFAGNLASDAGDIVGGLYQAVRHPIQTGQAIAENPGALLDPYKEQLSDPLGYGYEKPLTSLLNISPVAGAFGIGAKVGMAGKAATSASKARALGLTNKAGTAEQVANIAGKVSRGTDPFWWTAKTLQKGGKLAGGSVANLWGGATTAGPAALSAAAEAGFKGGSTGKAFRDNQLKRVGGEQAVEHAREAFGNINYGRQARYRGPMQSIWNDTRVQNFALVDQAIDNARQIGRRVPPTGVRRGYTFLPENQKVVSAINTIVKRYKKRGPRYHTLGDFDAMKREIGEHVAKYEKGSPARAAADQVYASVKESVAQMAPEYRKIMSDFDAARDQAIEISRTLKVGDKATIDSALRALQSTLRDTAHTNMGVRANLVNMLVDAGAENLVHELAGQSLRPWIRPGLGAQIVTTAGVTGAVGGLFNPAYLVGFAAISPRLAGSTMYRAGQAGKIVKPMLLADRALRKHYGMGLKEPLRSGVLGAHAAGRVANAQENKEGFKTALKAEANKRGIKVHDRVINSLVDGMLADDAETVVRTAEAIGNNKRLTKLLETFGGR